MPHEEPLGETGHVEAYAIKIPPFLPTDPQVWFIPVEAQFAARGITALRTVYYHIVGSLSLSRDCNRDQRPAAASTRGQPVQCPQTKIDRTHCRFGTIQIAAVVHGRRTWGPEAHMVAALNAATAW